MNRILKRGMAFCAAVVVGLAGCGPSPTDIRISSPMPPSAGLSVPEGKMLWPIQQETGKDFYTKYGFINEKGQPVIPVQYVDYSYGTDSEGRYRYLVAGDTERIDIYTLDGKKILEIAAESAWFIPGTALVAARRHADAERTELRTLLIDVNSGKQVLKKEYMYFGHLTGNILLAVDPRQREYVIDLEKGEDSRIPLEGNAYGYNFEYSGPDLSDKDFRLVAVEPGETIDYEQGIFPRAGYLGPDGKWVIDPIYFSAEPFEGDVARVAIAEGDYRYIDRQGNLKGAVPSPEEEYAKENGWMDGVFYYRGKVIEGLPSYCDWILFADGPVVVGASSTSYEKWYFLNTETGVGREIDSPGAMYRFMDWYVGWMNSRTVYDANGNELTDTVFHRYPSANLMPYFSDEPYLWVTTARYQGYVNADGEWLYRDSRFGGLID